MQLLSEKKTSWRCDETGFNSCNRTQVNYISYSLWEMTQGTLIAVIVHRKCKVILSNFTVVVFVDKTLNKSYEVNRLTQMGVRV